MKFTKMHGIGNDYIYVDCFSETLDDPSTLVRSISNRHFGVGADGLILISPSNIAWRIDVNRLADCDDFAFKYHS